jgi:hypothetical protein
VIKRVAEPDGSYTYNLTFSASQHTQTVSGMASFNIKDFPTS